MAGGEDIIQGIKLGEKSILPCFEIKIVFFLRYKIRLKYVRETFPFHNISLFLILEFGQALSIQIHEPLSNVDFVWTTLANYLI